MKGLKENQKKLHFQNALYYCLSKNFTTSEKVFESLHWYDLMFAFCYAQYSS